MLPILLINIMVLCLQQPRIESMIGKSKIEIQQTMANDFANYSTNNFGIKTNDNTLRFYNPQKDATLIFYFTNQQKCKHIKSIEDIDNLNKRIEEFNKQYTKVSNLKWKTISNQKTVNISIEKEEYNFTIIYQ